jgi:hypothetical protein
MAAFFFQSVMRLIIFVNFFIGATFWLFFINIRVSFILLLALVFLVDVWKIFGWDSFDTLGSLALLRINLWVLLTIFCLKFWRFLTFDDAWNSLFLLSRLPLHFCLRYEIVGDILLHLIDFIALIILIFLKLLIIHGSNAFFLVLPLFSLYLPLGLCFSSKETESLCQNHYFLLATKNVSRLVLDSVVRSGTLFIVRSWKWYSFFLLFVQVFQFIISYGFLPDALICLSNEVRYEQGKHHAVYDNPITHASLAYPWNLRYRHSHVDVDT